MPPPNNHGSHIPFASFRRSILTVRSDQVHSEMSHGSNIEYLELFQRQGFARFHDLSVVSADELLSVSWIHKLLDAFTMCQEDFSTLLSDNKALLSKPPADRLATEYFERTIKAMDIFNATRDGVETVRVWQKHLEIVVCALDAKQRMVGESQFRRARKALMDLALLMLDDKDTGSVFSHRNRSFGRKGKEHHRRSSSGHSRSLSWSVSHSWSASKQLQSIANNLVPPKTNEIAATNGLAMLIFAMSFILMFVLWILVAAIPCQDRGVQIHFTIPRQLSWTTPLFLLHSRIMDESKKRERRNTCGLLKEIYQIEKSVHQLTDLVDAAQFPLSDELKEEVKENVNELSLACEACKTGLEPLQLKLRETFRKVMACRTEGLDFLGKATEP
ncbi:protein ROH1-like isoform X1 [Salvia hispanica]|uniref:protein ROH1-like isoform X1 n=2 Tax=Salvia hispanica TaxID=49212 RepID=UPI0020095E7B|nr:protein ROH1-like isoform X1 [Salvia hispanica]XP_047969510.1 protein ROH1-like isoform X1 [Salvia hispanica]XP_047969511.1 protein ROH1-like isoform X1 [Salvia hispanica]XP_047969512.1 protein ROH1-like isoform X1 [Salvia hispanica]